MKNISFLFLFIFLISFAACKTTEANYRAAYETAKAGQQNEHESEYDDMINRELQPDTVSFGNVSLPVRRFFITAVSSDGLEGEVKMFNVALASFRQLFNARSLAQRLRNEGLKNTFVAQDRETNYFVIVGSTNDAGEADTILNQVRTSNFQFVKHPFPYIIRK